MRKEFAEELARIAQEDPRIILITGDLGFGVLDVFQREYPTQFVNSGITEQSSVSYVAGLARNGLRPFFYSIGNFPTLRAFEQIRNDVSFMELPVTLVAVGAGFTYGTAGYSHHLIEDFGPISSLDLDLFTPTMPLDVSRCLQSIISNSRPAYLRLGKGDESNYGLKHGVFPFPGDLGSIPEADVTILVNSGIIGEVVKAAEQLKTTGVSVAILACWNPTGIQDQELSFLQSRKKIVVIEEHVLRGGFGSFIDERLNKVNSKVIKIGINQVNKKVIGSTFHLREAYNLNASGIFSQLKQIQK